jgi:hypothetical protein
VVVQIVSIYRLNLGRYAVQSLVKLGVFPKFYTLLRSFGLIIPKLGINLFGYVEFEIKSFIKNPGINGRLGLRLGIFQSKHYCHIAEILNNTKIINKSIGGRSRGRLNLIWLNLTFLQFILQINIDKDFKRKSSKVQFDINQVSSGPVRSATNKSNAL